MDTSLKQTLRYYYVGIRSLFRYRRTQTCTIAEKSQIAAEVIRNVHSIEKGLSLEKPRIGFGEEKLQSMMKNIEVLSQSNSAFHNEVVNMALDVIDAYVEFHKDVGENKAFIDRLNRFVEEHRTERSGERKGGVTVVNRNDLCFDIEEGERFFNTRHSIRDFDKSKVDEETLLKAMQLAQRAPSACNRQGVRAYVLNDEQREDLIQTLSGVGGFAESVDKYVLITAKNTAYRADEINQYIVSASIYAGYLTMTLHLYGLGACVIQRPTVWTKSWERERSMLNIPEDEQLICLLAVGNLKETCRVPLSYRLRNDEMIRFL